MNIVESRFGNVFATCGFVTMTIGFIALVLTENHLLFIPISLGLALVLLRHVILT